MLNGVKNEIQTLNPAQKIKPNQNEEYKLSYTKGTESAILFHNLS
jgi:hypothetical protein